MKLKFLVPLLAFLALSALLYVGLQMNPRHLPSTFIGKPAPEFTLGLLESPEREFSPKDLAGQRWILNVWASWCVSCRYEHPLFNEIAAKTTIPLVGLNYKDDPESAKQWLVDRGNPYQFIPADQAGMAGIEWGVYGVPETFVIDEAGNVIYKHAGPINPKIVLEELTPLFPELQALEQRNAR